MNQTLSKEQKTYYYNPKDPYSIYDFCTTLASLLQKNSERHQELVILCIGSDRATGDCLGPIVGYKLSKLKHTTYTIYGTLEHPVHAKNLADTIREINHTHKNALIIAIDASLGSTNHIGYITLGEGTLSPGIGVDKDLPCVGDIYITGIVNISGMLNHMLLQTTRLDIVMKLADFICFGIRHSISMRND